jgi:GT2 family glycosyltransferase|tara:strand:+ start:123 stop:977 length:855 start_codon:yes stop_codon:yes gene_type:complete
MLSFNEVTLVIVSYKSKKKILEFLKKISINYRIIIIENSDDKTIKDEIKKSYKNVEILFTNNIGYGCSANYARTKIKTDYFFLMNPDLEGIDSNIIENFLFYAKKLNNKFSCIGPRYKNIGSKTLKQSDSKNEIGYVNAISGAAMFFNTKKFDFIGGFDGNIFLYFEETDYCKRGEKLKLYSYQLNSIKINHNVGTAVEYTSEREKNDIQKLCNWHFIWSKYYFYKKHYGILISILIFFPIILRSIIKIIIYKLTKNLNNEEKYKNRLDGLLTSICGKKSYKRI